MVATLRELFAKSRHPSHEDKEAAAQALVGILEQAQGMGREIARKGNQERGMAWGGRFTNLLESAWNIVTNFVQRIADWINEQDMEGLTEDDIVGEIDSLAERVGVAEITSAIEQEVLDELQAEGVTMVVSIAQPGACKLCLLNAEAGPIPIGSAFPSGDTCTPFHGGCRCNIARADDQ